MFNSIKYCGETFEIYRLFGNGFNAWTTYEPYCKQTTTSYTDDCFANVENQQLENTTRKTFSTFVPFTTTQKPSTNTNTVATTTLTAFNQFKYSAITPFSTFAATNPTIANKFVKNTKKFDIIATTNRPTFGIASKFNVKPTVVPTKSAFTPTFSWFGPKTSVQNSIAPIGQKTTNQHTVAVIRNNFITSTTPKPKIVLASNPFAFTFSTPSRSTAIIPSTISTPSPYSSTTKINLFDLYLGRLTTKAPVRYTIPPLSSLSKHAITLPNPYTVRTQSSSAQIRNTRFSNTYSFPDYFSTKSTTPKPSAVQVQSLFEAQATKFAQSLGIPSNSTYQQLTGVATSPRPRVWRYSFSGTKAP